MLAKFLECTTFVKNVLLESGALFSRRFTFTKTSILREQGDVLKHTMQKPFKALVDTLK